ncbi:MAG: nitrite/sulfite reductase [Alphaproteobacteria bacterium]|nr:nitrite/sulfite reductase [Alphaproteobacteria bacterium]
MMVTLPNEPIARLEDAQEFRQGLAQYQAGAWDETRWTGFRVRHGIYGQRQKGKHMVRVKVPGGLLPISWLPVIAEAMNGFVGEAAHLTTRQDIQLYDAKLEDVPALLEHLSTHGVTTRETGGNTVRNVTTCPQAGLCPAERVDAGAVAKALSTHWLRRSISQRMPRKFKIAVSGCASDCAGGWYHDLAFIAVLQNGRPGFRVLGGGGLGAKPMPGVELLDFVLEEDLAAVIEAVLRVHQVRSDRANRAAARLKFTLKRLNVDEIREEVKRELALARQLPQRPQPKFSWKTPKGEKPARLAGPRAQEDGRFTLVIKPRNGSLSIKHINGLYDLAKANGLESLRITTTQEILLTDLAAEKIDPVRLWLKSLDLPEVTEEGQAADLFGCLGTSTCPIGVVNAAGLVSELTDIRNTGDLKIRASGCHNACAQHHVADIGLHGVTRLAHGKPMPHYQIHLGGDMSRADGLALEGPVVPARLVPKVLDGLVAAWNGRENQDDSVRAWAERLGKSGLTDLVKPLLGHGEDKTHFIDWGESDPFSGPATGKGDCAAPLVSNDHLVDLAKDALERMDRALLAGLWPLALREGERAIGIAARRRLDLDHRVKPRDVALPFIDRLRTAFSYRPSLIEALENLEGASQIALVTGEAQGYREAIAGWLEEIERAKPLAPPDHQIDPGELEKRVAAL